MTCYSPLIRIEYPHKKVQAKDGHMYNKARVISTEQYEKIEKIDSDIEKVTRIPCGKCIGCKLAYSRDWAIRNVYESKLWDNNWFITVTYDDEHLYIPDEMTDKITGVVYQRTEDWKGCLNPKDATKFLKDLRRYWKYHYNWDNIRYYYCGEYGEKGGRPHFHFLIYNLPLDLKELKFKFINEEYQPIYECPLIEKIWGKGLVAIGAVTFSSCAYVARYITKKQTGEIASEEYAKKGQIPEYVQMSRMPGIGRNYYEANKERIYETDQLFMTSCRGNVLPLKPPRYYDKLFDIEQPEKMEQIKDRRKAAGKEAEKLRKSKSTATTAEQLRINAKTKYLKSHQLKRALE